jgi:hypothetical protein
MPHDHTPAERAGSEAPAPCRELARIAAEVEALGLDRDRSINLAAERVWDFWANKLARNPAGQEKAFGGLGDLPDCPPEVGSAGVAEILGVSKDTVLKLREAGLLPYRNAAPPGSARPVYRFPRDAVLKLRNSYRTEEPAPPAPKDPPRRGVKGEKKYRHLDLGDG